MADLERLDIFEGTSPDDARLAGLVRMLEGVKIARRISRVQRAGEFLRSVPGHLFSLVHRQPEVALARQHSSRLPLQRA